MSRKGSNIYRRADGRWEGRYYLKGTRRYKSVYGKTYTEAKRKLDRLRSEVLVPSARCNLLVGDVMKLWLEDRRSHIKESSYASYRNKLENQILPYFGDLKYSRLDLSQISRFVADKLSAGLSAKYISDMVIMLKSAEKWAERVHHYANRIHSAELPKAKPRETECFSADEQKQLVQTIAAQHDPTACGVLLTMFTGLRIGEVCALQWADIDFDAGILHIRKTVQRMKVYGAKSKSAVRVTAPKSATSVRDIPLPEFLLQMLATYRQNPGVKYREGQLDAEQITQLEQLGMNWEPGET